MPFKRLIADVERDIGETHAEMTRLRASNASGQAVNKLLGALAKLKAERLRLMDRQRLAAPD